MSEKDLLKDNIIYQSIVVNNLKENYNWKKM